MDLLQLQYFQTIARLENMTKASELLYVAQPNLSVSIKRLEEDLGVSLFDRRRGKIRLTPTGAVFLQYVDKVLGDLNDGIEQARAANSKGNRQVCVGGSIVDLMGNLLLEFLPKNRDVSFRQINARNSDICEKVVSGEADFGFIFGLPKAPGLEYMVVDACERIVELPSDNPLASRGIVSLKELAGQKFICNQSRDDEEFLNTLSQTTGLAVKPFFECDDNRVEVSMIMAGGGICIAPVSNYLKLHATCPEMACVRILEKIPQVQLGMIRKTGNLLSAAELQFYEMVYHFFQGESHIAGEFLKSLPQRK